MPTVISDHDPRIYVDQHQLRALSNRVRGINFLRRQPTRSVLNGRHASKMRGRGLNFEELRNYMPDDDVRSIDWKVTARTGEPYVRVLTEERDRPALIVVDQRMSMFFGSQLNMKSVAAAEASALVAHRILDQGDRIGGIVFGDDIIAEIRPRRSRRSLDQFLSRIVDANQRLRADAPPVQAPSINTPLRAVANIAKRNHLVIIVSDFDGLDGETDNLLSGIARRNDVVLLHVTDPSNLDVKDNIRFVLSDGVLQAEIDTGSARTRQALSKFQTGRLARISELARKSGLHLLPLSAGQETTTQMRQLFGLTRKVR